MRVHDRVSLVESARPMVSQPSTFKKMDSSNFDLKLKALFARENEGAFFCPAKP